MFFIIGYVAGLRDTDVVAFCVYNLNLLFSQQQTKRQHTLHYTHAQSLLAFGGGKGGDGMIVGRESIFQKELMQNQQNQT